MRYNNVRKFQFIRMEPYSAVNKTFRGDYDYGKKICLHNH